MAKKREFEGKDLAQALSRASRTLGIAERDIHYELLEGGRRGILGFGAKDVRILVEVPSGPKPDPVRLEDVLAEGSKPILEAAPDPAPSSSEGAPGANGAAAPSEGAQEGRRTSGRGGRKRSRGGAPGGKRGRRGAGRGEQRRRGKASRGGAGTRADQPSQERETAEVPRNRDGKRRQRGRRKGPSRQEHSGAGNRGAGSSQVPPSGEHLDGLVETVRRMTGLMGMELSVQGEMGDSGAQLLLDGDDHEMLLEKDGELLHAWQFLLNRMSRRAWPGIGRIQVTCPGFRRRRDDDLVSEIKEVASQVARTGEAKKLHPMNPYERRLVHLTIREYPGLSTESEGSGFMKVITVSRDEGDDGP